MGTGLQTGLGAGFGAFLFLFFPLVLGARICVEAGEVSAGSSAQVSAGGGGEVSTG